MISHRKSQRADRPKTVNEPAFDSFRPPARNEARRKTDGKTSTTNENGNSAIETTKRGAQTGEESLKITEQLINASAHLTKRRAASLGGGIVTSARKCNPLSSTDRATRRGNCVDN